MPEALEGRCQCATPAKQQKTGIAVICEGSMIRSSARNAPHALSRRSRIAGRHLCLYCQQTCVAGRTEMKPFWLFLLYRRQLRRAGRPPAKVLRFLANSPYNPCGASSGGRGRRQKQTRCGVPHLIRPDPAVTKTHRSPVREGPVTTARTRRALHRAGSLRGMRDIRFQGQ